MDWLFLTVLESLLFSQKCWDSGNSESFRNVSAFRILKKNSWDCLSIIAMEPKLSSQFCNSFKLFIVVRLTHKSGGCVSYVTQGSLKKHPVLDLRHAGYKYVNVLASAIVCKLALIWQLCHLSEISKLFHHLRILYSIRVYNIKTEV